MMRPVRFLLALACAAIGLWEALSLSPARGPANVAGAEPPRGRAPATGAEFALPIADATTPQHDSVSGQVDEGEVKLLLTRQRGRYTKHGWNHYGPGHFELDAKSGVLTARGGMGLFWYGVQEFADFVLELEFKVNRREANSGIFLRVPEVPVNNDYIRHSFEIQIDDGSRGKHSTGAVYDAEAPDQAASKPVGEWNYCRISFVGRRISVVLNSVPVVEWDARPAGKIEDFSSRGYIGLQNHDDDSIVQFRNLRVKDLR